MNEEYYTTAQAARELGVPLYTVRRYVKQGKLKAVRVPPLGWLRVEAKSVHRLFKDVSELGHGKKK